LICTTGTNLTDPLYFVSCSVQANQYTFENTSDSLLFGLVGGYATLSLQGTVSGVTGLSDLTTAHNSSFQFSPTPNLEIFQVNSAQNVFVESGPITWHPDVIFSTQFSGVSWVNTGGSKRSSGPGFQASVQPAGSTPSFSGSPSPPTSGVAQLAACLALVLLSMISLLLL